MNFIDKINKKKGVRFCQIVMFIGSLMVAIGGFKVFTIQKTIDHKENMKKALIGIIKHGKERKKKEKVFTKFTVDYGSGSWEVEVLSNQNTLIFDLFGNEKDANQTIFGINRFEPLRFTYRDKKVYVTTKVFDKDGKIVCEIDNNEWSVSPNNYYKRNYDDTAIEVIDQYNNVVLQVELLPNNIIEVRGIFTSHSGDCILLDGSGFEILKYNTGAITQAQYNSAARSIKRKFIYTGEDYLGKRVKYKINI